MIRESCFSEIDMADKIPEAGREGTSEIAPVNIISKFDRVLEKHFRHQRLVFEGREHLEHPRRRALSKAFEEFTEEALSNQEITDLVHHLIKDREYSPVFREWVRIQADSWDNYLLPQNTHRILAVGRNELLRKKGKKALSR